MLGPTGPDAVVYVDAATQTSPFNSPPLISPACPASPRTSFLTATRLPAAAHLSSTTRGAEKGENMHSLNKCMPIEKLSGPEIFSLRVSPFPSSFGPRRQTGMRTKPTNTRAVSLPESLCDEDLRLVLSSLVDGAAPGTMQQSRVVSMPVTSFKDEPLASPGALDDREPNESPPGKLNVDDGQQLAECSDSVISSAPSTPKTIVLHSLTSDLFDTPSPPPSSCDSVEFTLEDPELLPDSFLRSSISPPIFIPEKSSRVTTMLEDDGWITWASSPPRPIPALHGPSSLPYARCPSGAEGTIIEEQSSMPRMIWGLDPNDTVTAPQVPPQQQSRAIPIKPSSDIARRGSFHTSSTVKPALAPLPIPSSAPNYRFGNSNHLQIQGHQNQKWMSASPGHRPEERSDSIPHGMTSQGTGLGFIVPEEQVHDISRCDRGFRDCALDSLQCHRQRVLDATDTGFKRTLLVDEADKQRQVATPNRDERHGIEQPSGSCRYPTDLVDLFSSPAKSSGQNSKMNSRAPSSFRSPADIRGFLPTPPGSSSPQWTSVFSPVKNSYFSAATKFASRGSAPSANFKVLSQMNTTSDELSHELRRIFFENMSSSNPVDSTASFRAPPVTHISSVPAYSFVRQNSSFLEMPVHPPGIPIPDYILSQSSPLSHSLSAKGVPTQSLTPPDPLISTYRRSTLFNPRSIPLSRLRQNQKRGTNKLATVPEEESEALAHDKWLAPASNNLPYLALRTPSPLADRLQPRSVEEKAADGEQEPKTVTVRVRLPCNSEFRVGDVSRDLDFNEGSIQQESPKKKRPQRKKKSNISRLTNSERGFPLISEGTVFFGSMSANGTQEAQKGDAKQFVRTSL